MEVEFLNVNFQFDSPKSILKLKRLKFQNTFLGVNSEEQACCVLVGHVADIVGVNLRSLFCVPK